MTPLPKDPARLAAARALLRHRRVAALVHGREPLLRRDLVGMVAAHYGLSTGAAAAAVDRAVDAGEVECWITTAPTDDENEGPGVDAVLDDLQDQAGALERARREAGEGDGD